MEGNRTLSCLLVLMFLAACLQLAVMPTVAQKQNNVSLDTDAVAKEVLANEIMLYLRAEFLGEDIGHLSVEELRESAGYYPHYPRQITDSVNRSVTLYKPIERIIVLNSDAGEAVKILGAGEKVVGIVDSVQEKTFYFPEMSRKTLVGTWREVDWEEVVETNPDLVITYTTYGAKADIAEEKLNSFGIAVAGLNLYDPNHIPTEVTKLAILLESEERASKYLEWYEEYKIVVDELIGGKEKPKVFMTTTKAIGLNSELPTYGSGTTDNDLCEMTGGINVAGNLTVKYPKVSAEWVLAQNPDVVIIKVTGSDIYGWDSETEPKSLIADLREGKGWDNLKAIKNNRVYVVPWSAIYGMEQPFAMTLFAKIFYPELDMKPTEVYKEFLEEFMRVEHPEDKIFVYPDLDD
ncbi:Cobalamin-binding protein [ANME-1 cluster archaeon GoMg2]|nr:Cobalamin-binding protein [ANME-1 cluster archaeon GoMg2]